MTADKKTEAEKTLRSLWTVLLWLAICLLPGTVLADEERDAARSWAEGVFSPRQESTQPGLELRRQDHGTFGRNKSVLGTPLQVGDRKFTRGLGTHSTSDIRIRFDEPTREFIARVGVDNNHDTKGELGSVVFVVEAGGRELFRSGVCRGGQAPVDVKVELNGARSLVLRVLDGGDGPNHDHADWGEASIVMKDGKTVYLDELPGVNAEKESGLFKRLPFSFWFNGKSSADLLETWKRTEKKESLPDGRELKVVTYAEPAGGLEVRVEMALFRDFPAVDWVLRFTNNGKADSALLEQVLPLDLGIGVPAGDVMLHRAQGSTMAATEFLPIDAPLAPNAVVNLAPNGGRSSDGVLPYFNLAWSNGGLAWAIGWSGQWSQQIQRPAPDQIRIKAGQQTFAAKLHPGESIRTPRILLVSWQGNDRLRGHNLLRRVQLAHYVPRRDGKIVMPPVSQNSWFLFDEGNATTEENQTQMMRVMPELGVEAEWLDAGWFEGGWPNGVGTWVPKSDHFPRGLKPVGDEAHKLGLQFLVWFEPERVNPGSRIGKEHPECVLRKDGGDGLFNLGDPAALVWLTDTLSQCIGAWGIDIYRTDFNIPPLPFWQKADAPDRQGITENHYITGLYDLWDELLRRHPKLVFDDCASGGRRIDLETMSRSFPLSRSDTVCIPASSPAWDQAQTAGLSLYVPLHSTLATCGSTPKASSQKFGLYELRSTATAGLGVCQDTRAKDFPADVLKKVIAEVKALRPLHAGDFYPLTPITLNEDAWCAWQFNRPDLGKGCAVFFRRPQCPQSGMNVALKGLEPAAVYEVRNEDTGKTERLTGAALSNWQVSIENAPGSLLVTYTKR